MNGAESLLRTLVNNDITTCFTNPGTSEMQFVAAADRVPDMRCVLCLAEGVASGAADGYSPDVRQPAGDAVPHLVPAWPMVWQTCTTPCAPARLSSTSSGTMQPAISSMTRRWPRTSPPMPLRFPLG